MIPYLFMHTGQQMSDRYFSVDDPWAYNIRVQIFCRNQEEHDYLSALNLVHGREIEISIWHDWLKKEIPVLSFDLIEGKNKVSMQKLRVLPIAYTTFPIDLRGH